MIYEQTILINERDITVEFDVEFSKNGENTPGDFLNPPEFASYEIEDVSIHNAFDSDNKEVELSDEETAFALNAFNEEDAIREYEGH